MTGSIEIDSDGRHLAIRFPYRPDLVEQIKEIKGRRWDNRNKVWRVPVSNVQEVYDTFVAFNFEMAPEVTGLIAGTISPESLAKPKAEAKEGGPAETLTVGKLGDKVKKTILDAFPDPFWVVGQVKSWNATSKRAEFRLLEPGPRGRARADMPVILWDSTAEAVLPRLGEDVTELHEGMDVKLQVRVDFYAPAGTLQFVVEDIDPEFKPGK